MTYRVTDVECYRNYFLILALDSVTGTVYRWERHDDIERGRSHTELRKFLRSNITITFNGLGYDWWMISAYLEAYTNTELKDLSDYMIKTRMAQWEVTGAKGLEKHPGRHIDIMPVAPLIASLKIYAGRLNAPKLQDLPIHPDKLIDESMRDELVPYCINDLYCTHRLHVKLKPQILLRHRMGQKYHLPLTSKSDPQIAEAVIKKLLSKVGIKAQRPFLSEKSPTFNYEAPECIQMHTREMRTMLLAVTKTEFKLSASGSLLCPKVLREKINFGKSQYQLGIGGLHSNEKRRTIRIEQGERLTDLDVTSYYPSLILTNELYPEHLGKGFLKVYRSLVENRIKAKVAGDLITADALKIVINSSFGKFGNKYSVLYSPKLLLQTTFSGQLYLFMLIELIELRTLCQVVSANTDGITVFSPSEEQYEWMMKITRQWEAQTQMQLEAIQYKALFSQDVNNYVAVKLDGSLKGKGVFAKNSLSKNPTNPIVQHAAIEFLTKGIEPEQTIYTCGDIRAFCSLRTVNGGALYRDEVIGKTIRWYHSREGSPILYLKDKKATRVPDAEDAQLVMDMPEEFPRDVDHAYYIDKTHDLIYAVGGTVTRPAKKRPPTFH